MHEYQLTTVPLLLYACIKQAFILQIKCLIPISIYQIPIKKALRTLPSVQSRGIGSSTKHWARQIRPIGLMCMCISYMHNSYFLATIIYNTLYIVCQSYNNIFNVAKYDIELLAPVKQQIVLIQCGNNYIVRLVMVNCTASPAQPTFFGRLDTRHEALIRVQLKCSQYL